MCKIGSTQIDTSRGILTIDQLLQVNSISERAFCNTWYNVTNDISIKTINGYKNLNRLYIGDFQPTMRIQTQTCKIIGTYWCKIAVSVNQSNVISWKQIYDIECGQSILIYRNGKLISQPIVARKYQELYYVYDLQIQGQNNYLINNDIICFNYVK